VQKKQFSNFLTLSYRNGSFECFLARKKASVLQGLIPILPNIVVESRFCKYISQLLGSRHVFQTVFHFGLDSPLELKWGAVKAIYSSKSDL